MLSALHAMDKQVRASAAADLAAIGSAAVDPLVAALRDPRWEVRYRAAEALGQIQDPRVCAALAGALEDPRDHVRYMAAKGLGLRRCPGAVAGLCRALEDENEYVRRIAAVALGASVIEKHFCLSRKGKGPDDHMSLEPAEFTEMVRCIHNVELALGDGIKKPTPSEMKVMDQIRERMR